MQNGVGRRVVVVGAGPAGLTAAETLAERGFWLQLLKKKVRQEANLFLQLLLQTKKK